MGDGFPKPDLSEFEAFSQGPKYCVVARRRDELDEGDCAKLDAALAAEHISHNSIKKWFATRGIRVDDGSVKLHRAGECCCV